MMREKKGSRYLPAVLAAFLIMMYLLVPAAAADSFHEFFDHAQFAARIRVIAHREVEPVGLF